MSDVIDFLERMGQDSAMRHASLDSVLAQAPVSPQVRAALASRDTQALMALVGSDNVCCMVFVPLEEELEQPLAKQAAA
jgi:hypothetical protein